MLLKKFKQVSVVMYRLQIERKTLISQLNQMHSNNAVYSYHYYCMEKGAGATCVNDIVYFKVFSSTIDWFTPKLCGESWTLIKEPRPTPKIAEKSKYIQFSFTFCLILRVGTTIAYHVTETKIRILQISPHFSGDSRDCPLIPSYFFHKASSESINSIRRKLEKIECMPY